MVLIKKNRTKDGKIFKMYLNYKQLQKKILHLDSYLFFMGQMQRIKFVVTCEKLYQ